MIRARFTIRHDEESYKKGDLIKGLSAKEELRLVALNAAEYIISPEEELKIQVATGEVKPIDPVLFEELRKALDEEYNAEELTREARDVGVDLAGATTKKAVIEAVINQGKADELLEDEDGEPNDNQENV